MPLGFKTNFWSLSLPSTWTAEEDEACATMYMLNNGKGALQISSAYKSAGIITEEDLDDFATEDLPTDTIIQKISYKKFSGLYGEYITADKFWRKWWLRHDLLLIYITYNCNLTDKDAERSEVDEILLTLK